MNSGVNLLPSGAKFQATKNKVKKYAKYFSISILSTYLLVTTVVVGINVLMNMRLSSSQKKYQQAQTQYQSLDDSVVTTQKLKYQAKMVGKALNERFEYGSAFKRIGNLFAGLQVEVENYELVSGNTFKLTGATSSNEYMDQVEKKIIDINQGLVDGISKATLTNLSVTGNIWKFVAEVAIK